MAFRHICVIIIVLVGIVHRTNGQAKKITECYGVPERFNKVEEYGGINDPEYIKLKRGEQSRSMSSNKPWIVFSDRDGNQTYHRADKTSLKARVLSLGECFKVVNEEQDWIHIVKGGNDFKSNLKFSNPEAIEDYGWIEKDKMLLWTTPLRDKDSDIPMKAFVLNKAMNTDGFEKDHQNLAKIYRSPSGTETQDQLKIFDFDFIMKIEGSRYLLSREEQLTSLNYDRIMGWVDEGKLVKWDTRIVLEANHTEAAFEERKQNPNLQFVSYGDSRSAVEHAQKGVPVEEAIYLKNDPVTADPKNLDGRRFHGGVARLPMLSKIGDLVALRTGAIGDVLTEDRHSMSNAEHSQYIKGMADVERKKKNYNLLFAIEANGHTAHLKAAIQEYTSRLATRIFDGNVRIGGVFYDGKKNNYNDIKIVEVSKDISVFNKALDSHQFVSDPEDDGYTNMFYAIQQMLLMSRTDPDQTNIIVIIGSHGDFSGYGLSKMRAQRDGLESLVQAEDLAKLLARYTAHMIVVQYSREAGDQSIVDQFLSQTRDIILQGARVIHWDNDEYRKLLGAVDANPNIAESDSQFPLKLNNSVQYGIIHKPESVNAFPEDIFGDRLQKSIDELYANVSANQKQMSKILFDGDALDLSSGALTQVFLETFRKNIKRNNKDISDERIEQLLQFLAKERIKLYQEVYVPVNIQGAKHPLISYSVFMTHEEYRDYLAFLQEISMLYDEPPNEKRNKLKQIFVKILKKYTGETSFEYTNDLGDYDVDFLRERLTGLRSEGLNISSLLNFKMQDVTDEKKVLDPSLNEFILSAKKKYEGLQKFRNDAKGTCTSCFTTESGHIYYWIPIELTI